MTPESAPAPDDAGTRPVLARGAALVVIAALALRLWHVERLGLSHWDAGTFVAGPLEVGPYARADLAIFYAPPLVPALFQALQRLFGVVDTAAIAAVAVLGAGTVAATWSLGRRACGPIAALAGAAALAGMEYHVVFSRQALTDVPFTFFLTLFAMAWLAAVESGRRTHFLLAGIAAGLAMWTKYHGFFALVLAALHLFLMRVSRRIDDPDAWRALRGFGSTAAVAALAGLVLAAHVDQRIGIAALRANNVRWLREFEPYVFTQTAEFLARCFTSWVSPLVLAPALVGYAWMVRRRTRGDLLLLAWTLLLLAALPFYTHYPRLVVPLLVPLALAAGVGIEACVRLLARVRGRVHAVPVALALSGLVLVAGAFAARSALAVEDRGYARAGRFLCEQPPASEADLLITQHALLPYLHESAQAVVTYDEDGAIELLRTGRFRFVVADLRLAKLETAPYRTWLDGHAGELELVETIPNPLPETAIVNSAGFAGLDALRAGELSPEDLAATTTIRIWRSRVR